MDNEMSSDSLSERDVLSSVEESTMKDSSENFVMEKDFPFNNENDVEETLVQKGEKDRQCPSTTVESPEKLGQMESFFSKMVNENVGLGSIIPIPIDTNKKQAIVSGWNKFDADSWKNLNIPINDSIGIATRTGKESGLFVIDVDVEKERGAKVDGMKVWRQYIEDENGGNKIQTPTQKSPSGGLHIFFKYEDKLATFKNASGTVKINGKTASIDFRTNGGYIILAPSKRNDGSQYQWINHPRSTRLLPMPDSLYDWLSARRSGPPTPAEHNRQEGTKENNNSLSGRELSVNITEITSLLNMLNEERCDDYSKWMNVLFTLKNAGVSYEIFDNWSKKNPAKYDEKKCRQCWDAAKVRNTGSKKLSLGSLHHWAKTDNPNKYSETFLGKYLKLLQNMTCTDERIGTLAFALLKDNFVYSPQLNSFYVMNDNGFWAQDVKNMKLKRQATIQGTQLVKKYINHLENDWKGKEFTEDEKKKHLMELADLKKIVMGFGSNQKLKNSFDIALNDIADTDFCNKLDSDGNLFGFANGVFDLKEGKVRNAVKEDFISMSCKYDYSEPNEDSIAEVNAFLKQIIPIEEHRKFYLRCLGSCLEPYNNGNLLVILTGTGANGKTKLADELALATFGDYGGELDTSVLIEVKTTSDQASPAVFASLKKRYIVMSEPNKKIPMNCDNIKKMTGGDKITSRPLYGSPVTMKPHFKPFLLANALSEFNDSSDGMLRRLKNIPFTSRFVDDPKKPNEFKKNEAIGGNFDRWRMSFFHILYGHYRDWKENGLQTPSDIEIRSKQVVVGDNLLWTWFDANVIEDNNEYFTLKAAETHFFETMFDDLEERDRFKKKEYKKSNLKNLLISKTTKEPELEKHMKGEHVKNVWVGFKLKKKENVSAGNLKQD